MRLQFNEAKATQAAARLLELRGGRMSYLKLIKLLYLADREALIRWARPISADCYVSMAKGPVLSQTYNLIIDGAPDGYWSQHISPPERYEVALALKPDYGKLSDAELLLLEEIFADHGHKSRWDLVDLTHDLPEWIDPRGSAIPIAHRDILKAAGKTDSEIAAVESELECLAVAEKFF